MRRRIAIAAAAPVALYLLPFVAFEAWFYVEKLLNWKTRRSVVPQLDRVRFEAAKRPVNACDADRPTAPRSGGTA